MTGFSTLRDAVELPPLWSMQKTLRSLIEIDFETKGFSVLALGQRSGKTALAEHIASEKKTLWYGANAYCPAGVAAGSVEANPEDYLRVTNYDLVVLDEFFYLGHNELLDFWREHALVLAISSPDVLQDVVDYDAHNYASWEVNPNITISDLDHEFKRDPAMWFRDYAAFKKDYKNYQLADTLSH